ncbi:hypothetical protein CABS01_17003 [Colletotrichum abscissum]|uniref:uncharacterized protein n=1 Tax=Colletotrichum abscissum TaxID=1671311 RepID=UPI0027D5F771|nr:uncharacterized protein CABS01_17003 [Colletotrichum abscissum]KAK1500219.1 hypothetical protein CABS01_17003 [Colletotrichum abscissum]
MESTDQVTNIDAKDSCSRTPLLLAVLYGREAVVRLLLDRDANTEATDEWGRTSLLWAIEKGDEAVVQLLLNHGANTEAADKWGRTSLFTSTIHRVATLRTSRRDGSQARFDVRHRREGGGGSERRGPAIAKGAKTICEITPEPDKPRDNRKFNRPSDRDCWWWPIKELHAAIKITFEAWKKSEAWNKNVEAELRMVTAELQTVKSELQAVKGELQAMNERVEDESAKTNENLEAIAALAATQNSPSLFRAYCPTAAQTLPRYCNISLLKDYNQKRKG